MVAQSNCCTWSHSLTHTYTR